MYSSTSRRDSHGRNPAFHSRTPVPPRDGYMSVIRISALVASRLRASVALSGRRALLHGAPASASPLSRAQLQRPTSRLVVRYYQGGDPFNQLEKKSIFDYGVRPPPSLSALRSSSSGWPMARPLRHARRRSYDCNLVLAA